MILVGIPRPALMSQPDAWNGEAWHAHDWDADLDYQALAEAAAAAVRARDHPALGRLPFLVQREPTLRRHAAGAPSVPWHTDAMFGHQVEEWNVWVPMTESTRDSQRLWIELTPGRNIPVLTVLGNAFIFRGAQVRHGVMENDGPPRYSYDFRLLLERDYVPGPVSAKEGIPLRVPTYWREL